MSVWLCLVIASAQDRSKKLPVIIEELQRGESPQFRVADYLDDPLRAERSLVQCLGKVTGEGQRLKIINYLSAIERARIGYSVTFVRSNNANLLQDMAGALEKETSWACASLLARDMRDLFEPTLLKKCQTSLIHALHKWEHEPNAQVLLLAAVVPGFPTDVISRQAVTIGDDGTYYRCALLARTGILTEEQELKDRLLSIREASEAVLDQAVDAASVVESTSMKKFLAAQLRDTSLVSTMSGAKIPRRSLFAEALARMMRDDQSFPVKKRNGREYSAAELDRIEQWAREQLGVEFPKMPRKAIAGDENVVIK